MPSCKAIETAAEACASATFGRQIFVNFLRLAHTARVFGVPESSNADDPAITVPGSVTVPANGSTTLTVTVSAPQGSTVQGWVNLDVPGENDLHFAYYAHVVP